MTNPGWWYTSGSQCLYSRMATHWWPRAEWLGFHHYQNWGTTADGESCGLWNHYNPKLGSREELIAANAALKKLHCHFGGYTEIQGWTNDYRRNPEFIGFTPKKFFEKGFENLLPPLDWQDRCANMYMNGAVMKGLSAMCSVSTDKQAYMCVGDSSPGGWLDHLKKWCADINCGEYGCDTVYLDQTSCTPPFLCFNEKHGHGRDHGANGRNLAHFLKELSQRGRENNPDFAIAVEGMNDVDALWASFNLYVGSEQNKGDLFLYTHPLVGLLSRPRQRRRVRSDSLRAQNVPALSPRAI